MPTATAAVLVFASMPAGIALLEAGVSGQYSLGRLRERRPQTARIDLLNRRIRDDCGEGLQADSGPGPVTPAREVPALKLVRLAPSAK